MAEPTFEEFARRRQQAAPPSFEEFAQAAAGPTVEEAGRAAVDATYAALSPLSKVGVGLVGGLRGLGAGAVQEARRYAPGLPGEEFAQRFETEERQAVEPTREQLGYGTIGQALPFMAMPGGLLTQAGASAVTGGLQAEQGERITEGLKTGLGAFATQLGLRGLVAGASKVGKAVAQKAGSMMPARTPQMLRNITDMTAPPVMGMAPEAPASAVDYVPLVGRNVGARLEQVNNLRRLGFELTPGKVWGNPAREQIEANLKSHAATSEPFFAIDEANGRTYARIVARAIGVPGREEITPDVLGEAGELIGRRMTESARQLNTVLPDLGNADEPLAMAFDDALARARDLERSDIRSMRVKQGSGQVEQVEAKMKVEPWIDTVRMLANRGELKADDLMQIRSSFADEIHQAGAGRSDAVTGTQMRAMGDVIGAIDDLFMNSAKRAGKPELASGYATARSQWRVLQALEGAKGGDPLGRVSPARMATSLRKEYPVEYRRGALSGSDPVNRDAQVEALAQLFDATRGASTILPDIVANTGTATRMGANLSAEGLTRSAYEVLTGPGRAALALNTPSLPKGWSPRRGEDRAGALLKDLMERAETAGGVTVTGPRLLDQVQNDEAR